jgi:hypothetical protein
MIRLIGRGNPPRERTGGGVKDLNEDSFGWLIAFLLPGFVLLFGLSFTSDQVSSWLATSSGEHSAEIGGFLYGTLASLALGLFISAVRGLIMDRPLGWFGLNGRGLNYEKLKEKEVLETFKAIVANHYRYYQYYGNCLVALCGAFAAYAYNKIAFRHEVVHWYATAFFVLLVVVLFLASHDSLKSMYEKMRPILK